MKRIAVAAAALLIASALPTPLPAQMGAGASASIQPGEACPESMTEVRPGRCQAPQVPPPSIVDYRPESTLVTGEHLVPRARYPAVDFHGHPRGFTTPEAMAELIAARNGDGADIEGPADRAPTQENARPGRWRDHIHNNAAERSGLPDRPRA